jgi:hypothetical protein
MEMYIFNAKDVEKQLDDIKSALNVLSFAVNGLKNDNRINETELCGFEFVLNEANKRATALIKGLKPVWLGHSDEIAVIFGVQK